MINTDALEIAELLHKTTYVIDVFENKDAFDRNESYNSGSGAAINSTGDLITAAHVLTGTKAVNSKNLTGSEVIIARTEDLAPQSYGVVLCGIEINIPHILREPLAVDLAYLRPHFPRNNVPFVQVNREMSPIGTAVLMAGYPDEVKEPLSFTQLINYSYPPLTTPEHQTARKIKAIEQQFMIKAGILGYAKNATFNAADGSELLTLYAYYIDNGMHSGSSGGPVLNMQGELIGTITKRAVTTVSNLKLPDDPNFQVPSGSTLAISSSAILDYLERYCGWATISS